MVETSTSRPTHETALALSKHGSYDLEDYLFRLQAMHQQELLLNKSPNILAFLEKMIADGEQRLQTGNKYTVTFLERDGGVYPQFSTGMTLSSDGYDPLLR